MIEFKGECGHMIRARDEDVGQVVRCSYCGHESLVTPPAGDGMGGLLDEVERTGTYDARATRAQRKQHKAQTKGTAVQGGPADPFDVIKKMIYVAIAIVVIALAWNLTTDFLREQQQKDRHMAGPGRSTPGPSSPGGRPNENQTDSRQNRGKGLLTTRLDSQQQGVYVTSIPSRLSVYALESWDHRQEFMTTEGASLNIRTDTSVRFTPGDHYIAVAIRVNHPELMDEPGFPELRRRIESGDYQPAVLDSFFAMDGSIATRVEQRADSLYLVRVFEQKVPARGWKQVTALFLASRPISSLVEKLPDREQYGFDDEIARGELEFYKVPPEDHDAIITALKRIGRVVYAPEDSADHRVFRVDLEDGMLTSYQLR